MRAVVLDESEELFCELKNLANEEKLSLSLKHLKTTFSLITYIYDEIKGDLDLLIVNISHDPSQFITTVSEIQNYFPQIRVIFYSAYNTCAQEIFEATPTYFLLYPFDREKLRKAIYRVLHELKTNQNRFLPLKMKGQICKIPFYSIIYIESVGRKLIIYLEDGVREVNMTMEEIKRHLPEQFFQCHRSYIVNLDKVKNWSEKGVCLYGNLSVPVAKSQKNELKKYFYNG